MTTYPHNKIKKIKQPVVRKRTTGWVRVNRKKA